MVKLPPATKFWGGLALYILGADTFLWRKKHDSMSIQWGNWLQTPRGRTTCVAVWGTLTGHLFLGIPLPGQKTLKTAVVNVGKRKVILIEEDE